MNSKAALCKMFLDGRVVNVRNAFEYTGLTNCAREVSRMIEQPFGVHISRTRMEGKSRYGQPCTWYNYFLNKSQSNIPGIDKMKEYVKTQLAENKIEAKKSKFVQPTMF